jgi:hypothetical protein
VLSEARRHGISSRLGTKRVDVNHAWIDPILVAGPWILAGGIAISVVRSVLGSRRS